jgi:hypothetical protein
MYERLIDELRYEYGTGRLVPFLGSGMSRPVCRDWPGMITKLEQIAARAVAPDPSPTPTDASKSDPDDLELTRRAARALEQLRREGGADRVADAVREALLESDQGSPTKPTATLARFQWPLVLTTNYDDLYVAAVHEEFLRTRIGTRKNTSDAERRTPPVEVVGRSEADCQRILSALRRPAGPLLWALQGFLPGQAQIVAPDGHGGTHPQRWDEYVFGDRPRAAFSRTELAHQIVVGHAEYRAVAMRSESFRRAFAEVYRSRSLFFLGSGLRDRYLLDLFNQIVELYGPSSQQHYAVVTRGRVDTEFMRRYFGIWVLEVDDRGEIPSVVEAVASPASLGVGGQRWSYGNRPSHGSLPAPLSISAAPLTAESVMSKCVVVSGGGSKNWIRLSRNIRSVLVDGGLLPESLRDASREEVGACFDLLPNKDYTWALREELRENLPGTLLVARARLEPDKPPGKDIRPIAPTDQPATREDRAGRLWRDLRIIKPVMQEVLGVALAWGHDSIVSTLLATGSLRAFPPSFALQEMVRAWASEERTVALDLHTIDKEVLADLRSGRLDLAYLMSGRRAGDVGASRQRFWLEVVDRSRTERILELRDCTYGVCALLSEYWLDGPRWLIDVWPKPCLEWSPWTLETVKAWQKDTGLTMSLERLGLFHGSTLRVTESSQP